MLFYCDVSVFSAESPPLHLTGEGSGQVVAPNTCIPKPLCVQLEPTPATTTVPVRFSIISVPKSSQGCRLLATPAGSPGAPESINRVPSKSGEAKIWAQVGDTEGTYIITAEYPSARNVITFFVHARRRIWKYLIPLPIVIGIGLVAWGIRAGRSGKNRKSR